MATPSTNKGFFRCPVQPEDSAGTIRIGLRRVRVTVQERSIDGFTVLLKSRHAPRLKVGRPWVLRFDGESVEVHPEWYFHRPGGQVQVGLRRLRELTPLHRAGPFRLPSLYPLRARLGATSDMWLPMAVAALILLVSLPGVGDRLGTTPRIREGVGTVVHTVDGVIRRFW